MDFFPFGIFVDCDRVQVWISISKSGWEIKYLGRFVYEWGESIGFMEALLSYLFCGHICGWWPNPWAQSSKRGSDYSCCSSKRANEMVQASELDLIQKWFAHFEMGWDSQMKEMKTVLGRVRCGHLCLDCFPFERECHTFSTVWEEKLERSRKRNKNNLQSSRSSRDISFFSFLLSFLRGLGGGLDSAAWRTKKHCHE